MNNFAFAIHKESKPGVFSISPELRDRFFLVKDADGWVIYSTCDCLLTAMHHKTKHAALEVLRDFLSGVPEKQLSQSSVEYKKGQNLCQ